jgi:hypothetical protein
MTKNEYDREQQRILFDCAAKLYKLAYSASDLHPDIDQGRIDGGEKLGKMIEVIGHEQAIADNRQTSRLARLRAAIPTTANQQLKAAILAQLNQ